MTFKESVKTCLFKKHFAIRGRASRSEYWWFYLFQHIIAMTLTVVIMLFLMLLNPRGQYHDLPVMFTLSYAFFYAVISLILVISNICVTIRRLHDIGKSGWYYLILILIYCVLSPLNLFREDLFYILYTLVNLCWLSLVMSRPGTPEETPNPYGGANCG